MKPLDSDKKAADAAQNAPEAAAPAEEAKAEVTPEPIDFSNVQIEPLFTDYVDFVTFASFTKPCQPFTSTSYHSPTLSITAR